ncbi:MAG: hypothetical protein AAB869_00060 [Patescibacteria group bacterium]
MAIETTIIEQLKKIANEMGEQVSDEDIERHIAFCEELEENIFLCEAGEIVKTIAASVLLVLVRGEYELKVKSACVFLVALVLQRCKEVNLVLEQEVRRGLVEVASTLAWDFVQVFGPRGQTQALMH